MMMNKTTLQFYLIPTQTLYLYAWHALLYRHVAATMFHFISYKGYQDTRLCVITRIFGDSYS